MRPGALILGVGLLLGLSASAVPCAAQTPLRRGGLTVQVSLGTSLQHLAALPSVKGSQFETQGRTIGGTLPSTGPATLLGMGAGVDLVLNDRLLLPIFDLNFAWAVGRYPTVYGAIDGSILEEHPWRAWQMQAYAGGIGARWKHRRWAFGTALQPGIAVTSLEASLADGVTSQKRALTGAALAVRGTAEACRRFSPEERGCVFFGVHLYQDRLFNGGTVGFRWELGP